MLAATINSHQYTAPRVLTGGPQNALDELLVLPDPAPTGFRIGQSDLQLAQYAAEVLHERRVDTVRPARKPHKSDGSPVEPSTEAGSDRCERPSSRRGDAALGPRASPCADGH